MIGCILTLNNSSNKTGKEEPTNQLQNTYERSETNSMENDKPSPTTNIEDTLLVAFMVFKGHQIKEWKSDNGHVSFDILGEPDKIEKDMADYYDPNYCVSITEFVRCFKEVKSRMYNFKNLNVTIKKEKE